MGVVQRRDSPWYWLNLERAGQRPLRESTRIAVAGATPEERKRNRALADAAYRARMGDLARERYDLPPSIPPPPQQTIAVWAGWYSQHVVPTHRGAEREREILATLVGAFGPLSLSGVTREVVREWTTRRLVKARPSTVNREIDTLKALLRTAVEHGHLKASPLAGMRRLHVSTPARRLLTPAEEARLLKRLAPDDKAIFLLALDSLIRLGDVLDLRREDDRGKTVWIADPKAGGGFEVPISRRTRAALNTLPTPEEGERYLFPRRRKAATERDRRGTIRQMLERVCQLARVPCGRAVGGISWHWATRRTGATRMIRGGIDPATVQRVGRWKRADVVLEIYSEGSATAARQAVELVSRTPSRGSHTRK
jgi:integrase